MAGNHTAEELLQWGLRNAPQNPDGSSSLAQVSKDMADGKRPDLADPGLYDAIMGKSEAQLMQEELGVAVDTKRSEDDRCTALDNFEMLIEQVDNANNMEPLHMWKPVLALLQDASPRIQTAAAWIVGTAVQNNATAQAQALLHGVLPLLLPLLDAASPELRSKGMYAISAELQHYPRAVTEFSGAGGWEVLNKALRDASIAVRRKTAFFVNLLIVQYADAPADAQAPAAPAAPVDPAAPLEKPAATVGGSYPDIPRALRDAHVITSLLVSVLPVTDATGVLQASGAQVPKEVVHELQFYGPQRNESAREDIDYAEKASQAVLTFLAAARREPEYALPPTVENTFIQDLTTPFADDNTRADDLGLRREVNKL
ncbi:hsp70 nucleotide exchange factor fes1 [Malassezia sp. CBS 17886]|nr:hsp70 nucleotide exchange factor fes1 [Malassezia sp. CBS 17886]